MRRIDPYCSFLLDMEVSEIMNDQVRAEAEMRKPPAEYTSINHITNTRRPLWAIYRKLEIPNIRSIALMKLLGGSTV